ncbi:MAG: hypothetical protein SOU82_02100 [Alloprevotella sp.]|nr:hypothetical protein [Alloprevotella sp.]
MPKPRKRDETDDFVHNDADTVRRPLHLPAIRRCVISKNYATCAECHDMSTCALLAEVANNAPEVWNNLKEAGAEG